jgi:hypothetical protein
MAFTALPVGGIFGIIGVINSFGDYTELNMYPMPAWAKFCDGSEIVDVDSPLNGTYVPDLTASVPVGSITAGIATPARTVGDGIYCFGEHLTPQTISNTENTTTIKYFMRIR